MKQIEHMSEEEVQKFCVALVSKVEALIESMNVEVPPLSLVLINPKPGPLDKSGWCTGNCNPLLIADQMKDVIEMIESGKSVAIKRPKGKGNK